MGDNLYKASEEDEKVGWRQGYGSNVFKYYILQEYGRTTDDEEVVIDPIEMLTSMRNVDAEVLLMLQASYINGY